MVTKAEYLDWLCELVHGKDPRESYSRMLGVLFTHSYSYDPWLFELEKDRTSDGLELRRKFVEDICIPRGENPDAALTMLGGTWSCSVLEMLVALAVRIDRDVLGEGDRCDPTRWFWDMIRNLDVAIPDSYFRDEDVVVIDKAVDRWLARAYEPDGTGGIFPIPGSPNDQRKELTWYQMHEYLIKNFM